MADADDPQPQPQARENDPPAVHDARAEPGHEGGTYALSGFTAARRSLLRTDQEPPDPSMPEPSDKAIGDADRGHEGVEPDLRIGGLHPSGGWLTGVAEPPDGVRVRPTIAPSAALGTGSMDDCTHLKARAEMLHREAMLGMEQALDVGPASPTYRESIEIANRVEEMAVKVEERLAEEC